VTELTQNRALLETAGIDCGDTRGIYYGYGQSAHGYRFLDYWLF
jgi:hypothetical protein